MNILQYISIDLCIPTDIFSLTAYILLCILTVLVCYSCYGILMMNLILTDDKPEVLLMQQPPIVKNRIRVRYIQPRGAVDRSHPQSWNNCCPDFRFSSAKSATFYALKSICFAHINAQAFSMLTWNTVPRLVLFAALFYWSELLWFWPRSLPISLVIITADGYFQGWASVDRARPPLSLYLQSSKTFASLPALLNIVLLLHILYQLI